MFVVFTAMVLSLFFACSGKNRLAVFFILVSLILGIRLFFREIDSPANGFHMPWLQVNILHQRQQYGGIIPDNIIHGDVV